MLNMVYEPLYRYPVRGGGTAYMYLETL